MPMRRARVDRCTSTWTRSSCRSSCGGGPSCAASRSWWVAPVRRGVVAAASYEARRYGVHSALPSAVARRRCPQAVFLPGDHALYSEVSEQVHAIFDRYTPLVEPLALDEAFLDVSAVRPAVRRRGRDRARGSAPTSPTSSSSACSVGVAPNKFLAKLASVSAKPQATPDASLPGPGVVEVVPGRRARLPAPAAGSPAVGCRPGHAREARTARRPHGRRPGRGSTSAPCGAALGQQSERPSAGARLGTRRSAGRDRIARPSRSGTRRPIRRDLLRAGRARTRAGAPRRRRGGATARAADRRRAPITLKVRFAGFRTITRSVTLAQPVDTGPGAGGRAAPGCCGRSTCRWACGCWACRRSNLVEPAHQLSLLDDADAPHRAAGAIDEIRERFGSAAIGPASAVGPSGFGSSARALSNGVLTSPSEGEPGDTR